MAYTVYATSQMAGQQVRRFDLTNITNNNVSLAQAEMDAKFFAELQNTNRYLNATDWQPLVLDEQLGEPTFVAHQNSQTHLARD
jgi:uncharacterized protein YdaL